MYGSLQNNKKGKKRSRQERAASGSLADTAELVRQALQHWEELDSQLHSSLPQAASLVLAHSVSANNVGVCKG